LEWHVIIRQLDRASVGAAVLAGRSGAAGLSGRKGAAGQDGGSDVAVMTAEPGHQLELGLSCQTDGDGHQVVSMTGELDIATAEQAYVYVTEVIDTAGRPQAPVSMDLSALTFCDASGLRVLARLARHARLAGRQLRLISARPAVLKIIRITGLDRSFPELVPVARAY
jgi:anti-anti-sigma factor